MAKTMLDTNRSPIISMEQQTTVFSSSTTLGTAGFTIPAAAHELHCYPSAKCHFRNNGTATTGGGSHEVTSGQMFVISHENQATVQIIAASGSITLTIAFMK